MNKNSKNAENAKFAALKLAEIQATDKEDFVQCTNDMARTASLNDDEAVVVASAIRAKYLPNIAKQAGIKLAGLDLEDGKETVDFANDESDDEEMEFHHFKSDEEELDEDDDEMSDDDMEDSDEADESDDVATFEIEVPADMVDQAQKAVQEALDNLLGGDLDSSEDEMEDMDDMEDMDSDDEDEIEDENTEKFTKNSNEVRNMTKQALAERKAQREALLRRAEREEILMKLAAEEEAYPAHSTFKYNEDMVNMEGEIDYPSMSFEGGEGNSLKEQNPSWAEQRVPTNNPDSLQFPDVTKPMKFEGSGDGSLEYVVDWESLENPSEGLEDANLFEVPTQMPNMPHKTTRANAGNNRIAEKGKEKHTVECTSCGTRMAMSDEEMERDSTRCANDDCPTNKESGEDHKMDKEAQQEVQVNGVNPSKTIGTGVNALNVTRNEVEKAENMVSTASLDLARIKTAYGCSSKLALAGIITSDEVDSYAEQMLNDGLKADSMIRQTKLLLKSAQTSTERVAAAAAEKMTKTASTLGVSTSPAFNGSFASNSAALDIQGALKGTWTMPKLED
jgi:ssDNA-binding Zn-finger/Zn-ribbon topoisomerase 1